MIERHPDADSRTPRQIVAALRAEVENQRMQLAACGVLAMSNTPESLAEHREIHPAYDCASVQDVIRMAEREIALRAENAALREALEPFAENGKRVVAYENRARARHGLPPLKPHRMVTLCAEEQQVLAAVTALAQPEVSEDVEDGLRAALLANRWPVDGRKPEVSP